MMHTLLPMIADKTASNDECVKVMKEVLICVTDIDKYSKEISKLPFLKVDTTSVMKSPNELYNPTDEELCKLFYKQPIFPLVPFNHPPYVTKLMRCGLKCTITATEIQKIIKDISKPKATIPQLVDEIAMTRSCAVLKHISDNARDFQQVFNSLAVASSWLPIQCTAPEGYPNCLRWRGSHSHSHFISFCESVVLVKSDVIPYIAGSQVYIVRSECTFSPSELHVLNCTSTSRPQHVLDHFKEVIDNYKKIPQNTLLTTILHTYNFLMEHYLQCDDLHTFSHPWIWTGDRFVYPKVVAMKSKLRLQYSYKPYHYIVPTELHKYEKLFTYFGVQSETTDLQLVDTIAAIKHKCELDEADALEMIICILNQLTAFGQKKVNLPGVIIYVPTESESLELENSKEVVYSDNECLRHFITLSKSGKKYNVIHSRISSNLAKCLCVLPLSNYISKSEYTFRNLSQHEPLTKRLNNILRDYKDGLTIIKELIQNADDAGATEINICFDARTHNINSKMLIFPGMASSHGPALVVHNNAQFTENDFENITKLAGATKMNEPVKIGKFGLGFCSVYHITDIPSLISGDSFVVFDPTGKHLSESESGQPRGQRIDLAHPIFKSSKQLDPYRGLYGFDCQDKYSGTIFRLPFRVVPSEISGNIYTEVSAKTLESDIFEAGSKLLIFLNNVAKINFSIFSKETISASTCLELHKARRSRVCDDCYRFTITKVQHKNEVCDHWMVSKCDGNLVYQGVQKYALASVACLLQCEPHEKYTVKSLDGESFCYLPLSCQTGLPMHISSNFAVLSNRRGIWTADSTVSQRGESESEWNIKLMQTVIPKAYVCMLNALKVLFEDDKLKDYNFYTVWPLAGYLKQHDPWTHFIQIVYQIITSCKLLYSVFALKWFDIKSCQFLTSAILCLSNEYTNCAPEVVDVLRQLKLQVVMSPQVYLNEIVKNSTCTVVMFTETCFIDQFYCNVNSFNVSSRVAVLKKMFQVYSLSKNDKGRFSVLRNYLVSKPSVPCIPDGELLRTCADVIDPKAVFAQLFDREERRFPMEIFCNYDIILSAIKELGMISSYPPWIMLEERARQIPELYKRDACDALKRLKVLLQCANHNIKFGIKPDAVVLSKLSAIPCFPTKQRPLDFPLEWYGTGGLRCSKEMVMPSDGKSIDFGIVAGSRVSIVCSDLPEQGGCGDIPAEILSVFGFYPKPTLPDVLNQLKQLINFFMTRTVVTITSQIVRTPVNCETITHICSEVYRYFETYATSDDMQSKLLELRSFSCVWSGTSFVHPSCVADQWRLNGPFLYRVPSNLDVAPKLKKLLNIKEQFSTCDIIGALGKISDTYGMQPVDKNCHEVLRLAISELTKVETLPEVDVMMPSDRYVMHKAKEMYYRDDEFWPIDESCMMINENLVPNELARRVRAKPVRFKKLEMCGSQFGASPFGQREKLTQRIKNILSQYPFDITVMKELLQNADDAKATKMFVILDCRNHGDKMVPSDEWKNLQGPALLVWNDSTFSDKDIEGIQELGLGSKRLDAESIGQYGIGFNVVYHLTDCPSFITNDVLYVLDPHCRYIPQANPLNPGGRYDLKSGQFLQCFEDLKSPYLYTNFNGHQDFHSGSLFRFPLRHTTQLVEKSEITNNLDGQDQTPVTISRMKEMIMDWAPKLKRCLYFLQNITEIKYCSIEPSNAFTTLYHYKCNLADPAINKRNIIHAAFCNFSCTNSKPCTVSYPLEVIEFESSGREMCREQWIIQQGVGDMMNESQKYEFIDRMKPKHGIAAPLNKSTPCSGEVFCFLPLPIKSGFPVHINGQFFLDASRRALWTSTNPDERTSWNGKVFKSISSSYANLLAEMTLQQTFNCDSSAIENNFYNLFPKWKTLLDTTMEGNWLQIAKDVYRNLVLINAHILYKPIGTGTVRWHPIHADECDQMYFDNGDIESELKKTFERLGMNITHAPLTVRDHFMDVGTIIPAINPNAVYTHYTNHLNKRSEYPFESVSNFKAFSQYVLQHDPFSNTFHFPGPPFGHFLLLTADCKLQLFDSNNKVLVSQYSHLFPKHLHMFLHSDLINLHYSKDYFLTPDECTIECIKDMIGSILPHELCNVHHLPLASVQITQSTLHSLWKCLSSDAIFKSKLHRIVQHWALLLTTGKELFSYSKDHVVPIIIDQVEDIKGAVPIPLPDIVEVLVTLGLPIADVNVVGRNTFICPHTSDHSEMLHNLLNFHNEGDISSTLNEKMVNSLLEYFRNINFHTCEDDLHCFLKLPLCMDVTKSFKIPNINDTYLWPNEFPDHGILKWLNGSNVVFVQNNWKWTTFFSSILQIHEISPENMYLKYVFKHFSLLNDDERYEHLKYIRDDIYSNRVSSIFKASLQKLPCIRCNGTIRCISDFCDPREKVFLFIGTQFVPLPACFHDIKWLDFFSSLGLRKSPTKEEFLDMCQLVAKGISTDMSHHLLECLIAEEAWYFDRQFLSKVSVIPFVCTYPASEVSWILQPYKTPSLQQNSMKCPMIQLCGSGNKMHTEILWTVKPLVHLETPKYMNRSEVEVRLNALKVITNPSISDVIENIKCICKSRFSSSLLFYDYPNACLPPQEHHKSVMDVMVENFQYLKDHNGFQFCQCLKELPCIPVPVNLGQNIFVLVKPAQVMVDESASNFHPYLHALPNDLSQFTKHLYSLGVAKILELSHIRLALELIYHHNQDLNTNIMVKRLMDQLYSLLKQSKDINVDSLHPLYLPSSNGELNESSQLFYQDSNIYGNVHLLSTKINFFKLPEACSFTEMDVLSLLPHKIRPKPFSKHCTAKLHCQSTIIQGSKDAEKLNKVLTSSSFHAAICSIVTQDRSSEICSMIDTCVKHFQHSLKVHQVDTLKVQLLLGDDEVASPSVPVFIEMREMSCNIYMKAGATFYELRKIHTEIGMKITEVISGEFVATNIGNLQQRIAVLLMTESVDEIRDYLMTLNIKLGKVAEEQNCDFTPIVGGQVPSTWLPYINHNVGDIYRPEEWVGYKNKEGMMIFSKILCQNLNDLEHSQSHTPCRKYIIRSSSVDTTEVSDMDLFKIPVPATSIQHYDMDMSGGDESSRHDALNRSRLDGVECINYISLPSSIFHWQNISPSRDIKKAERWLSQAKGDFEALTILNDKVADHPDICCNVCFMAHEVAEKALKAGRYATRGISSDDLKYHKLKHHAYAIMSERPATTQGLAQLVEPLESYYLDTRFPDRWDGTDAVPKGQYNPQQASDAKEKACNILRIIRTTIYAGGHINESS